jgi:hypothetical protein
MRRPRAERSLRRPGSILVMVLVTTLLLSLLAITVVYRRRTDDYADSAFAGKIAARSLADSGVQLAAAYAFEDRTVTIAPSGAFYTPPRPAFSPAAFRDRRLGGGTLHLIRVAFDEQVAGLGEPIDYGYADEAGKLNINVAGRDQWRQLLDAFKVREPDPIIDAVQQWRGVRLEAASKTASKTATKAGAGAGTGPTDPAAALSGVAGETGTGGTGNYNTEHAAVPFRNKSGFFETPDELLRVTLPDGRPAIPRSLYYGTAASGPGEALPPGGLAAYVTVWSADNSSVYADGSKLVNINQSLAAPGGAGGAAGGSTKTGGAGKSGSTAGGQPETGEQKLLRELTEARVDKTVIDAIMNARRAGAVFFSVGDLVNLPNLPRDRYVDTLDKVTTLDLNPGAINVNTAPEPVVRALLARVPALATDPGRLQSAADRIIGLRGSLGDRARNIGWLLDVLSPEEFRIVARYATVRSFQHRVDALAVLDDDRTFHRVEAVIDVGLSKPRILYYRDATWRGRPRLP